MTIYQILKESGISFTKDDCNKIGIEVAKTIKGGEKIKQLETFGEKSFTETVRPYAEENRGAIEEIISNYYANKTL